MKNTLVIVLILLACFRGYGQEETKLIISSFEHCDRTIDVDDERVLENHFRKERIEYRKTEKGYECFEHFREKHESQWDGDSTKNENTTTKPRRWKKSVSNREVSQVIKDVKVNAKPLGGISGMLHTSHHRLFIYFEVIENGDTTTWRKTKPFELNTPWENFEDDLMVVSPELDELVTKLTPRKFNGRKEILSTTTGIHYSPAYPAHWHQRMYAFSELQCIPQIRCS